MQSRSHHDKAAASHDHVGVCVPWYLILTFKFKDKNGLCYPEATTGINSINAFLVCIFDGLHVRAAGYRKFKYLNKQSAP
jgi:hypothetical protein